MKECNKNKLTPFKWFCLQNFPFIEEDFDAITNYQLLCKIVEYLNKTIAKTNELGEEVEYLINWFNNLDVQEEVDNKIDEMYESGQLSEMILQYLEIAGILAFDTKADLKAGTNFINGSIARTIGTTTYNDGYGNYYKIRTITSSDVIDDDNILTLANYPTLIAEKLPDNYIADIVSTINTSIQALSNRVTSNEMFDKTKMIGGTITPSYVGDFISEYQFASVLRHNDYIYCFSPNNYDSKGEVRIFSISDNVLRSIKTNKMLGHANSVCYDEDNDKIIIAPMFEYNQGTPTNISKIYSYDTDFNSYDEITVPERFYAVSYDSKTNTLYGIAYTNNTNTIKIYKRNDNTFDLYTTIGLPDTTLYMQDCAIDNSVIYIIDTEGAMRIANIKESNNYIEATCHISRLDSGNVWKYGEPEGLEFDSNGNLYQANNGFTGISNPNSSNIINCSFVTQLNCDNKIGKSEHTFQTVHNTLILSSTSANKFKLENYNIRSLNQLSYITEPFGIVRIPYNEIVNENGNVRIVGRNIKLEINGTYIANQIQLSSCNILFYINTSGTLQLTADNYGVDCVNTLATISIRNRGIINLTNENNEFCVSSYAPNLVAITELHNPTTMKINGVSVSSAGLIMGSYRVYGTT